MMEIRTTSDVPDCDVYSSDFEIVQLSVPVSYAAVIGYSQNPATTRFTLHVPTALAQTVRDTLNEHLITMEAEEALASGDFEVSTDAA